MRIETNQLDVSSLQIKGALQIPDKRLNTPSTVLRQLGLGADYCEAEPK